MIRLIFLILTTFINMSALADNRDEEIIAIRKVSDATIIYFGIDKMVGDLIDSHINNDLKRVGEKTLPYVKMIVERRMELEWKF